MFNQIFKLGKNGAHVVVVRRRNGDKMVFEMRSYGGVGIFGRIGDGSMVIVVRREGALAWRSYGEMTIRGVCSFLAHLITPKKGLTKFFIWHTK